MPMELSSPPPAARLALRTRRALAPWFVGHSVMSFSAALAGNSIYYYAHYQLGTPLVQMLWMAALGGFIYIFSSIFGGRIVDRFGQRRVFLIAGSLTIPTFFIGYIAVALHSVPLLFVEVIVSNLIISPMWPAVESVLTRSPGKMKLAMRVTCYNLIWSSTCFLAFFLTGTIAALVSWRGIFIVSACGAFLSLLIIFFIALPQSMIGTRHIEDDPREQARSNALRASGKSKTLLWMAWVSNSLSFVSANTLSPIMPVLTLNAGITSPALATAIGSIAALTRLIGFLFASLWTGWHYQIRWMLIFFGVMVVSTGGVLISRSPSMLVFTQIFLGLAWAMLYSGSLYYSMHLSHGSGQNAGIHEAVIGIGTVIGPTLAALVGGPNALGPKTTVLMIILVVGGAGLFAMARQAHGIAEIANPTNSGSDKGTP